MRTIRLVAASMMFAAIFAVSAFAQTATGKIGLINTIAFEDPKTGITKYVAAMTSLETEFKAVQGELAALANKIQALEGELKALQEQAQKGTVPVNQATVQAKADEYEKLGREFKFKQEDAKARFERREAIVMGPIRQDIGVAIQEFTKKNGYAMMLDVAKMYNEGMILGIDETADVTKAFVAFYNARPATTTATTTK